jgi:hypothetical protein
MDLRLATLALMVGTGVASIGERNAAAAPAPECPAEVAALAKDEAELPRLEVANPADRPPYCITLETIMAFAARVKTHVARCPASTYAIALPRWDKTRSDYAKLFVQRKCKRTF